MGGSGWDSEEQQLAVFWGILLCACALGFVYAIFNFCCNGVPDQVLPEPSMNRNRRPDFEEVEPEPDYPRQHRYQQQRPAGQSRNWSGARFVPIHQRLPDDIPASERHVDRNFRARFVPLHQRLPDGVEMPVHRPPVQQLQPPEVVPAAAGSIGWKIGVPQEAAPTAPLMDDE